MNTHELTAEQNSILGEIFGTEPTPATQGFIATLQSIAPESDISGEVRHWGDECREASACYDIAHGYNTSSSS